MSSPYVLGFRKAIIQSVLAFNDAANVRTHIKVLVGIKGESERIAKITRNLEPFLKEEPLMQIQEDNGSIVTVSGEFLILSIGQKASVISFGEDTITVNSTVNRAPASCTVFYGSIGCIFCPDIPMSVADMGLLFRDNEDTPIDAPPTTTRPTLRIVK